MKLLRLILFPAILLVAITSIAGAGEENMIKAENQIILNEEYRPDGYRSEKWKPSAEQVQETLTAVRHYIDTVELLDKSREYKQLQYIKEHFQDYTVQLVGFEFEGKKKIWCNFIHISFFDTEEERKRWSKDVIRVLDGGQDFWQLVFEPATNEITSFYINGEA